ncbi:MAG: outer membrane beta-barrel protein [Gemmatimonadaceae bacterium]
MKRSILTAAITGIGMVSISFAAAAQTISPKPVQFGVAAGAVIPSGDISSDVNTGFNGTVIVGFQPSMIPLGIRIDGAYNQMGAKGGGGNAHVTSVTGNLVYKFPSTTFSPYAIGGAGWCNAGVSVTGFGTVSENHFCWNAGAGISMPLSGFDTFIEAGYNRVLVDNGNLSYIPITFGVMF